MRRSETIAALYFLYLLVPTAVAAMAPGRKLRIGAAAVGCAALALVARGFPVAVPWNVARDWMPGVLLVAGYWLPGALVTTPNLAAERWLVTLDDRVFRTSTRPGGLAAALPRLLREYLELAYLFCYPLVPLVFAMIYASGGSSRADRSDLFWSTVLAAVFVCYGLLPWIQTRPPRMLESGAPPAGLRQLNAIVLDRVSVQVNTFPSGHVAAAVASAIEVSRYSTLGGVAVFIIAVSIAAGAVVGRYHYLADVVLGAVVAVAAASVLCVW